MTRIYMNSGAWFDVEESATTVINCIDKASRLSMPMQWFTWVLSSGQPAEKGLCLNTNLIERVSA